VGYHPSGLAAQIDGPAGELLEVADRTILWRIRGQNA
jgi:hypothetical protein